jgi:very-short-patch-repair endonuclease
MRKNLPFCKVCNIQLKDKRSETCKKHVDRSYCKGKPSFNSGRRYSLNLTPEQRKQWGERSIGRKMPQEAKEKIRKWHTENHHNHFKDTLIERIIEAGLTSLEINFKKQFPVSGVSIVDFYLPDSNTIIQCDGCYWHGCPIHFPNHHQDNYQKGVKQKEKLESLGYTVIRLWEHDIKVGNYTL